MHKYAFGANLRFFALALAVVWLFAPASVANDALRQSIEEAERLGEELQLWKAYQTMDRAARAVEKSKTSTEAERADALQALGRTQMQAGKLGDAVATQRRALELRERIQSSDTVALAMSRLALADALIETGQAVEARGLAKRSLADLEGVSAEPALLATAHTTLARLGFYDQNFIETLEHGARARELEPRMRDPVRASAVRLAVWMSAYTPNFKSLEEAGQFRDWLEEARVQAAEGKGPLRVLADLAIASFHGHLGDRLTAHDRLLASYATATASLPAGSPDRNYVVFRLASHDLEGREKLRREVQHEVNQLARSRPDDRWVKGTYWHLALVRLARSQAMAEELIGSEQRPHLERLLKSREGDAPDSLNRLLALRTVAQLKAFGENARMDAAREVLLLSAPGDPLRFENRMAAYRVLGRMARERGNRDEASSLLDEGFAEMERFPVADWTEASDLILARQSVNSVHKSQEARLSAMIGDHLKPEFFESDWAGYLQAAVLVLLAYTEFTAPNSREHAARFEDQSKRFARLRLRLESDAHLMLVGIFHYLNQRRFAEAEQLYRKLSDALALDDRSQGRKFRADMLLQTAKVAREGLEAKLALLAADEALKAARDVDVASGRMALLAEAELARALSLELSRRYRDAWKAYEKVRENRKLLSESSQAAFDKLGRDLSASLNRYDLDQNEGRLDSIASLREKIRREEGNGDARRAFGYAVQIFDTKELVHAEPETKALTLLTPLMIAINLNDTDLYEEAIRRFETNHGSAADLPATAQPALASVRLALGLGEPAELNLLDDELQRRRLEPESEAWMLPALVEINLMRYASSVGKSDEAVNAHYVRYLQIAQPSHLAPVYLVLANRYIEQKRFSEALAELKKIPDSAGDLLRIARDFGEIDLLLALGEIEEGYKRALSVERYLSRHLPEDHPNRIQASFLRALAEFHSENEEVAVRIAKDALERMARTGLKESLHSICARAIALGGFVDGDSPDFVRVRDEATRILGAAGNLVPENHWTVGIALSAEGFLRAVAGDYEMALPMLRNALKIFRENGDSPEDLREIEMMIADIEKAKAEEDAAAKQDTATEP